LKTRMPNQTQNAATVTPRTGSRTVMVWFRRPLQSFVYFACARRNC